MRPTNPEMRAQADAMRRGLLYISLVLIKKSFFLAILSYCNRRMRLLESFPTMYRSRGRSRVSGRSISARLSQNCGLAG